jgi:hypothetical protein
MTNFQDKHPDTGENSLPLPGFLAIEKKSSGDYDRHYKNTYIMDG